MKDLIHQRINDTIAVKQACDGLLAPRIEEAALLLRGVLQQGGKILVCGNGGSAADAQHFAAELVGRYLKEREALPAIALTTDTSILTAVANDYGYQYLFGRQIQALGRQGDALIVISTSGQSQNVMDAVGEAQRQGMYVVALTGGHGGGTARALSVSRDIEIRIPSTETPRIQEAHIMILHILCELIEL